MTRILYKSDIVVTQTTTTYDEPSFSTVDYDQIFEDYKDHITDNCTVNVTETITPSTEVITNSDGHPDTVDIWIDEKTISITNNPTKDPNDIFTNDSDSFFHPAPKKYPKGTIWDIHAKKIQFFLNQMGQGVLSECNHNFYQKRHVCLGHDLYHNFWIHHKDKRKKARELSAQHHKVYEEDSPDYKKCVTTSIGLEERKKNKFRFFCKVYHVDNHKNCDCFKVDFFTRDELGKIQVVPQKEVVKKCLGHVEHIYTFPKGTAANAALRNTSHSTLESFKHDQRFKNPNEGTLMTHAFPRPTPIGIHNDLFIFFQHKDNQEDCQRYCYVPNSFDTEILVEVAPSQTAQAPMGDASEVPYSLNNQEEKSAFKDYKASVLTSVDEEDPKLQPDSKEQINYDEGLLRLPLELDTDGYPCAEPQPFYKPSQITSVGGKKCSHGTSLFINGMWTGYDQAVSTAEELSKMQEGNEIVLVYNSTLGAQRDIIKQLRINQGNDTSAGVLLKEYIMSYFEKADKDQVLHINAHSQGGAILKQVLPSIPSEHRKRMFIDTYGTAGYIGKEMAEQVRNVWHPKDFISKKADQEGWEKAKEDGTLVVLEDDGKSAFDAHALMDGYITELQLNNESFAKGEF